MQTRHTSQTLRTAALLAVAAALVVSLALIGRAFASDRRPSASVSRAAGPPDGYELAQAAGIASLVQFEQYGDLHHLVERGETLGAIARRYGRTTGEIAAANGIRDPDTIIAGQRLLIPGRSTR